MEQQNITSQDLQTPKSIEAVPNLGAYCVIDDNSESKDGGFDVTSDEKTEESIGQALDFTSDNDNTKDSVDGRFDMTSDYKPEDEISGGQSETLQNNFKDSVEAGLDKTSKKLENSTGVRCSVTLDGTSGDRQRNFDAIYKSTADDKSQDDLDGQFDDVSPIDSDNNQSGYEGDVDTRKSGESSGNLTDSDSDTRKTLAKKAKSVIQKAIAKLDLIAEENAEVVAEERSDDKGSDEPGSSCTNSMVSDYDSTDLEKDTNIPKEILYKLLGKENKVNDSARRCSMNSKRKLSTDDG